MPYLQKSIFIFFIFISFKSLAQDHFSTLGETRFAINKKVSQSYEMNFTLRSRYFLYQDRHFQYQQQQVDFYHLSKLKMDKRHALSLGVYYRTRDPFDSGSDELRFIEQFTYKPQKQRTQFIHRFRAEQRFLKAKTIFRQRYRFSMNLPLKGDKLDIGEAYFTGALEGLQSLSEKSKPELDERTTAQIGWKLSDSLKLQTGLEHRGEALNIETKHYLFVLTKAVLSI
ncbi:DUF2490 domain-containing protein [Algibacter pacificus]|uniref:DUF2490 domain-containing protein n=1 Tax=Algibacter pacificus TaxID=2599389 RepID=UPI0011C75CBC|nr:DUF2490 domain-containing protein [Algibacter pacificus]